jgi:pyridoxamine 5'-phosphate oxidase
MKEVDERKEYGDRELLESSVASDPLEEFEDWYTKALATSISEPNAMNLATSTPDGAPSSRMVLLRGFSEKGFVFYTNYQSQKGRELEANPRAALCFYWDELDRQLRISVTVEKLPEENSRNYFQQRPRNAQISAYVSEQSSSIKSREELESLHRKAEETFRDEQVPFPKNWGGYLAQAYEYEFWQGRLGRLHDRIKYTLKKDGTWEILRLCP